MREVDVLPAPAAILLAAGASRRMGTSKALLPCPPDGIPLVRSVAQALQAGGAAPLIVVVAPGAVGEAVSAALDGLPGIILVVNPSPERGMLSSVQVGVRALLALIPLPAAFLVSPCDLPCLKPVHVRAVIQAGRGASTRIVAPVHESKRGHPTLFGVALAAEILALDPERFGLNEVLRRRASDIVEVALSDDGVLRDADTPEDWRTLTGIDPGLSG